MTLDAKIAYLTDHARAELSSGQRIGIEKEGLRVDDKAALAKTPHPSAFGSALTHPHITMDFSEALLELITPPLADNDAVVTFLNDLHAWIHRRMGDELLWPSSMPCITKGETDIPLAHFGSSNAGRMKKIYRRGLGHRYGRTMQTIAGIHYNYSFNENLWPILADLEGMRAPLNEARSALYLGLTRNVLRFGWIVPFLFGSSPAICKTFVDYGARLQAFDEHTLYLPSATSLRMGDIGYQNNQGNETGSHVSYNSLREYLVSLKRAVETPCERYRAFGIKVHGRYEQLNANILQIENEYYASVRPKCTTQGGNEAPLLALARRGVEYVELRSLDLLAFSPIGIEAQQLDFLEAWLTFCLFDDKPPLDDAEAVALNQNEILSAHNGRAANAAIIMDGKKIPLRDAGTTLCERMTGVCELLDAARQCTCYTEALAAHRRMFCDPEQTPSARQLDEMRAQRASYIEWAERKAIEFHEHFLARDLAPQTAQHFDQLAEQSMRRLSEMEQADTLSLDEYIDNYFARLQEIDAMN